MSNLRPSQFGSLFFAGGVLFSGGLLALTIVGNMLSGMGDGASSGPGHSSPVGVVTPYAFYFVAGIIAALLSRHTERSRLALRMQFHF